MNLDQLVKSYSSESDFITAVNAELIKLCEENPEFVYSFDKKAMCAYNGPAFLTSGEIAGPKCNGCIFGQVLQNLGWNDKTELSFCGNIYELFTHNKRSFFVNIPLYWSKIQEKQDCGAAWGSLRKYIP